MPFDALSISVLKKELNNALSNSRIEKIFQPKKQMLLFEVFHPFPKRELRLLISIHPQFFRTHLISEKPSNPQQPPAFCMLLRKYLQGGRILQIEQPPWERVIFFRIENFQPGLGLTTFSLIFEAMGRNSNLILIDANKVIIDALKRFPVSPKQNREIMPGETYKLPPAPARYHPGNLKLSTLQKIIDLSSPNLKLNNLLSREVFGLSRPLILEILKRAEIPSETTAGECNHEMSSRIFKSLDDLNQFLVNDLHSVFIFSEPGIPIDFFPYKPLHLPENNLVSVPNLNTAIESTLHQQNRQDSLEHRAEQLHKILKDRKKKALRKKEKQEKELSKAEDADRYRLFGELITVYLKDISRGQSEFVAHNYYDPKGGTILIPLDPALNPVENSQLYYKKYNKAKKGQKKISQQLRKTEMELEYYESLENSLQDPLSFNNLIEIEEEMVKTGLLKVKKQPKARHRTPVTKPNSFISSDGSEILVGRNNSQNDTLTMKIASTNDLWLHTQKIPGSHVIIRSQGSAISNETLVEAANLAVYFSKARGSSKIAVDYTEKRHVRKPKGSPPGFVLYDNFKTIIIDPDPKIIEKFKLK
jgi:predicted ribosome quality control (RQC) complex YloA/Tae2 family protein